MSRRWLETNDKLVINIIVIYSVVGLLIAVKKGVIYARLSLCNRIQLVKQKRCTRVILTTFVGG